MKTWILALTLAACAASPTDEQIPLRALTWATTIQALPEASDVPDRGLREALHQSGLPWLVRHEATGIELVLIPPGRYLRGAPYSDSQALDEERPAHGAHVRKFFYIARTETTQAQWQTVFRSNPSEYPGATRPVENITVPEAYAFCREAKLSLPTETQWEWACRAGSTRNRYGAPEDIAWYYENSAKETHPVGLKAPNGFGLFDMFGNVWELTRGDWTESYDDFASEAPIDEAKERIAWKRAYYQSFRGGSWISVERDLRASRRQRFSPGYGFYEVGFRVARLP